MKVALIDNMNNSFFAFCRHLRDLGVEADLFCAVGAKEHFTPTADTFMPEKSLSFVFTLPFSMSSKSSFKLGGGDLKRLFDKYDIIVACGGAPAFLHADGIRIDFFVPYGSDLCQLPFPRFRDLGLLRVVPGFILALLQRKAIKNSRVVAIDANYGLYGEALAKLGIRASLGFSPMVYMEDAPENDDPVLAHWQTVVAEKDFVVFNHSRQYWCSNLNNLPQFSQYLGAKRNDKVIRAFARFVKTTRYRNPLLVLFEYGPDVDASKALVRELGIERFTVWLGKTHRKHILHMLKDGSIACNSFREGLAGIGGASYEALMAGVPLINNMSGIAEDPGHFFHDSPILHAISEDEILETFIAYEADPEGFKQIGEMSSLWFEERLGAGLAKKYLDMMVSICEEKEKEKLS